MLTIKEVVSKREQKQFITFPLELYKDNEYFIPSLWSTEKAIFNPNYHYNKTSKSICFIAYKDGKVVGRIQGIYNSLANEKWNQNRVRFTRFDSIDDQEVANALFDKVVEWAKSLGADTINGPLGYSDFEREGLLIEGFDQEQTYEEQYNYDYYQKLIENYGFEKEVDWLESRLFPTESEFERLNNLAQKIKNRHGFKLLQFRSVSQLVKRYGDDFFKLLDASYKDLYQTVPFLDFQQKALIKDFKILLTPFYIRLIVDKDDKLAALGLCFPPFGKHLRKSGGKLTLPTIYKILKERANPEGLDLGLIGVAEEYKNTGVSFVILNEIIQLMSQGNIKYCETNLNLETNLEIQNCWKRFKSIQHKRRRAYIYKI